MKQNDKIEEIIKVLGKLRMKVEDLEIAIQEIYELGEAEDRVTEHENKKIIDYVNECDKENKEQIFEALCDLKKQIRKNTGRSIQIEVDVRRLEKRVEALENERRIQEAL